MIGTTASRIAIGSYDSPADAWLLSGRHPGVVTAEMNTSSSVGAIHSTARTSTPAAVQQPADGLLYSLRVGHHRVDLRAVQRHLVERQPARCCWAAFSDAQRPVGARRR